MKCSLCDERMKKIEACFGDKGILYENKPLCESCSYEDEPADTVLYGGDDQPYVISGTRNETEGDFSVQWRSTDPWKGYYETKSDKYSLVNTAELLAWHESEKMLRDFNERIRELSDEHDIDYARVFARSSNIFYQNYDLYVKKEQELLSRLLVAKAKIIYGGAPNFANERGKLELAFNTGSSCQVEVTGKVRFVGFSKLTGAPIHWGTLEESILVIVS